MYYPIFEPMGQMIEKGTSQNIVLSSSFRSWTKITGQLEQDYCHPFYSKNPHRPPSVSKRKEKTGPVQKDGSV